MTETKPVGVGIARIVRERTSVRHAANVIVATTLVLVVVGGALMRVTDRDEYSSVWEGMWWALQTVTTVGYGDVTPTSVWGRVVASLMMLEGIAFLTVVIATITSVFVARERRDRVEASAAAEERAADLDARLDAVDERLSRIEVLLRRQQER